MATLARRNQRNAAGLIPASFNTWRTAASKVSGLTTISALRFVKVIKAVDFKMARNPGLCPVVQAGVPPLALGSAERLELASLGVSLLDQQWNASPPPERVTATRDFQ